MRYYSRFNSCFNKNLQAAFYRAVLPGILKQKVYCPCPLWRIPPGHHFYLSPAISPQVGCHQAAQLLFCNNWGRYSTARHWYDQMPQPSGQSIHGIWVRGGKKTRSTKKYSSPIRMRFCRPSRQNPCPSPIEIPANDRARLFPGLFLQ